jgi:hypothetical protein
MKNSLAFSSTILLLLFITGCSPYGGIGRAGSPAWMATASPYDIARYNQDRIAAAQQECIQYGLKKQEVANCVATIMQTENLRREIKRQNVLNQYQTTLQNMSEINNQSAENYRQMEKNRQIKEREANQQSKVNELEQRLRNIESGSGR